MITLDGVADNDPIELHSENGYVEITTLGTLLAQHSERFSRGGEEPSETIVLNDFLIAAETDRGGLRNLFKSISIFGVKKELAKLSLAQLASHLEHKLVPKEGLFKCYNPTDEIADDAMGFQYRKNILSYIAFTTWNGI